MERTVCYHRTHERQTIPNERIRFAPGFPTWTQVPAADPQRHAADGHPVVEQSDSEWVRLTGGHA